MAPTISNKTYSAFFWEYPKKRAKRLPKQIIVLAVSYFVGVQAKPYGSVSGNMGSYNSHKKAQNRK